MRAAQMRFALTRSPKEGNLTSKVATSGGRRRQSAPVRDYQTRSFAGKAKRSDAGAHSVPQQSGPRGGSRGPLRGRRGGRAGTQGAGGPTPCAHSPADKLESRNSAVCGVRAQEGLLESLDLCVLLPGGRDGDRLERDGLQGGGEDVVRQRGGASGDEIRGAAVGRGGCNIREEPVWLNLERAHAGRGRAGGGRRGRG